MEFSWFKHYADKSASACFRNCRVAVFLGTALLAVPSLPNSAAAAASLILYNGQHEQTVGLLIAEFQKETGIAVKVHSSDGPEIASQIIEEGTASPADVFFTENSPEIAAIAEKGLLAEVDSSTLTQIPAKYNSPTGDWVGVLARENVLAYNPSMLPTAQLPRSLLDLADPAWKGKIAVAPSDNDFLPLVSGIIATQGKDAALQWLKGLKENAQIFEDDEGVTAAVNRGAVAAGIINNYYWARLEVEQGAANTHSALYHFGQGDIGGLINISAAGVLKTSKSPKEAQRFIAFLVSKQAQDLLARDTVDFEYPLRPGVAPNSVLKPFSELQPPPVTVAQLGDDGQVLDLLREAGLL